MAAKESQMSSQMVVNQQFNVNPMLTKMRKVKDKINVSLGNSKLDKSQDDTLSPFSNEHKP